MKLVFKIILAITIAAGILVLALYLYSFWLKLVFSYNFLTAVD